MEHVLLSIIYHYRYAGLFTLLSLGLIGIPVPDEFLMAFSGFQTTSGHMSFGLTLLLATLGSFTGMNISYWIGRKLGTPFLHKIAPFLHLNEKRIARAECWFKKFGDKLIVIGYFFPGFRHFTAYFAGMSELSYGRYAILTGTGALLWSSTFITLGRILGIHWKSIITLLHSYLAQGGILLAAAVIALYLFGVRRSKSPLDEEN